MNFMQDPGRAARRRLERRVTEYLEALERGDFDTVEQILTEAESDPELEAAIWQTQIALAEENPSLAFEQDATRVREVAAGTLSGAQHTTTAEARAAYQARAASPAPPTPAAPADAPPEVDPLEEPRPVTLGAVAERLVRSLGERNPVVQRLAGNETPLGDDLSERRIRGLLSQMGLPNLARNVVDAVKRAASALTVQHQKDTLRFAATRKQRERPDSATAPDETKDAR